MADWMDDRWIGPVTQAIDSYPKPTLIPTYTGRGATSRTRSTSSSTPARSGSSARSSTRPRHVWWCSNHPPVGAFPFHLSSIHPPHTMPNPDPNFNSTPKTGGAGVRGRLQVPAPGQALLRPRPLRLRLEVCGLKVVLDGVLGMGMHGLCGSVWLCWAGWCRYVCVVWRRDG